MIYRPMGKSGVQVSALSMGGGHLPDDPEACDALLRACVDAGINYFETATVYCNGQCQQKIGRGLEPVRSKAMISAKRGILLDGEQPGCPETTPDEYRREILDVQLPNLRTDHVEWLQVGWFTANKIDVLRKKGGVLDAIHRMISEKIVGHVGFTSHDTPENVIKIIESGMFESCTLQYNLLNRSYEPCLAAAREHGVAVVVMGPLAGGMLGRPELALRDIVSEAIQTSRAGLNFVLANPAVSTACSGMTTMAQLAENLASISSAPGAAMWEEVRAIFQRFNAIGKTLCTGCNYCRPCPSGVDISRNLRLRNYYAIYAGEGKTTAATSASVSAAATASAAARRAYAAIPPDQRAGECNQCGACEAKCPNKLPVRDLLTETAKALG